jgi:sporulation protein YlmC with PRC-barrel domain
LEGKWGNLASLPPSGGGDPGSNPGFPILFKSSLSKLVGEPMTMKLSDLYGMDIFTDTGKFLGTAQEIIIDVERGEIVRILLEPLPSSKERALEVIREKSILYKNVKSVEDVVVVSKLKEE